LEKQRAPPSGRRRRSPRGAPKPDPQKPGRKPGKDYGTQAFRRLPDREPDQVIDVPLPGRCPRRGGRTRREHVARQFQVEIPRQPIPRRFDVHIGVCACCGQRVHPRHPLQTSDALGAAATRIGPDAQSLIALLKNKLGLSYGDITTLMTDAWGIELTRGAAAHVVRRAGERAESVHDTLKAMIPGCPTVYPDETGWKNRRPVVLAVGLRHQPVHRLCDPSQSRRGRPG
jgi:transposase